MLIISPSSSDEIIHFLTQVVFIELAFPSLTLFFIQQKREINSKVLDISCHVLLFFFLFVCFFFAFVLFSLPLVLFLGLSSDPLLMFQSPLLENFLIHYP